MEFSQIRGHVILRHVDCNTEKSIRETGQGFTAWSGGLGMRSRNGVACALHISSRALPNSRQSPWRPFGPETGTLCAPYDHSSAKEIAARVTGPCLAHRVVDAAAAEQDDVVSVESCSSRLLAPSVLPETRSWAARQPHSEATVG